MSGVNPAGTLSRLLGGQGGQQADRLNVALPCKVVAFDETTLLADVQPLLKLTGDQPAQLLGVPTLGQKVSFTLQLGSSTYPVETTMRPKLQRGDVVFVVCADAEIKNTLSGQVAAPDTGRRHSRNDAVIVGVLPCSLSE
ncbi:hypothetical protein PA598K_01331 [Paenibacillus sp. 598K]|uniref:Gp138 family membrane-puncturing spike protein n=1 Tax=Paenibacillus sp. 598K TaxID=1117987 RepID=UPI000FFA9E75|nr:Gp138 family membrane-puncturing spike protein [Paenibacillus sp. 598K]GBF73046.1 hypothetical protein PA598K_01331 [Paenibacillus sp. 598K]